MPLRVTPTRTGRHFLHIPGPTNLPDRVLRAIDQPIIDHRGPEFAELTLRLLDRLKKVFQTSAPVILFPCSGSGAWEAALVNTLSPGDRVLMFETGHFATQWAHVARALRLDVEFVPGDWRSGVDPEEVGSRLAADQGGVIKAVALLHNETSTGAMTDVKAVRAAMDAVGHPALFIVDAISSLGSMDYRHDAWGVDVTVAASQKGLMMTPGIGFNAVSTRALEASRRSRIPNSYWMWEPVIESNSSGYFPYTPPTNLLFGLDTSLQMLFEEGLQRVFRRHQRLACATRRAVETWGLEIQCQRPQARSDTLTAIRLPEGFDADELRRVILDRFDLSLGTGLGRVRGKLFRIGHVGYLNDLMLTGALCGVEMGLRLAGIPYRAGGVQAALDLLASPSYPSE